MGHKPPITAVYLRVSTGQQKTDSQKQVLKTWLRQQGLTYDTYAFYEDHETGTHNNRHGLDKLLEHCRQGKIATVVVTRLDRLARSLRGGLEILHELTEKGIRVIAVQQNLDFSGAQGRFLSGLFMLLGQWERDIIVERISAGLKAAKARGVKLGRKPNLEKRAEIKRLRESGLGVTAIAKTLGVSRQSVYRMLQMPVHAFPCQS